MTRRACQRELERLAAEMTRLELQRSELVGRDARWVIDHRIELVLARAVRLNLSKYGSFTPSKREAIFGDHDPRRPGENARDALVDSTRNPALPNYRPK